MVTLIIGNYSIISMLPGEQMLHTANLGGEGGQNRNLLLNRAESRFYLPYAGERR